MRVSELMRPHVRTIAAHATVAEAVQSLADAHISGMPVIGRDGRVLGVISTTDILEAEAEHDDRRARTQLFENTLVEELMSTPPLVTTPDADVREAVRYMLDHGVHRLFVVRGDELVGVLSQTDITRAIGTGAL
ncbi:MAG: CBS domain-containing protein [Gemmatimonadaceae bacterium]|nr:CBS domain-containing protein [Gemmatimonadaceae bacterium]